MARSSAVIFLAVTTRTRNARGVRLFVERRHHVKAVDLGHHQIEHDQVRQLAPRGSIASRVPVGSQHGIRKPFRRSHQVHSLWIVIDHQNFQ
jgi:hypothetical protein